MPARLSAPKTWPRVQPNSSAICGALFVAYSAASQTRSARRAAVESPVGCRPRQLFLTLNPAELLRQIHRRQETFWRLAHTTRAQADDPGAAGNPGSPHPS